MAAHRVLKVSLLRRWFRMKPVKPSAHANRLALRAGKKQASNGPTPALQEVVLMSLRNDAQQS